MQKKQKIAISISADILEKMDAKIDKVKYKNRSHVIESFIRKGLELKQDMGAVIIANENRWENGKYLLDYSKSLIEVDGKKLIEKQIENLIQAQVDKIVVAVSEQTMDVQYFLENKKYNADISFLKGNESDDSGKIFEKAKHILQTQKIICILGDSYFHNLNYLDVIYFHNNSKNALTIVVKPEGDAQNFGNIILQGNKIINFKEKPQNIQEGTSIINTGFYIINSDIVPERKGNYKLEYDFFPQYIKKFGAKAYFHNGAWFHCQSDEVLKLLSN